MTVIVDQNNHKQTAIATGTAVAAVAAVVADVAVARSCYSPILYNIYVFLRLNGNRMIKPNQT